MGRRNYKKSKKRKWFKKLEFDYEGLTTVTGYVGIREKGQVKQPGFHYLGEKINYWN